MTLPPPPNLDAMSEALRTDSSGDAQTKEHPIKDQKWAVEFEKLFSDVFKQPPPNLQLLMQILAKDRYRKLDKGFKGKNVRSRRQQQQQQRQQQQQQRQQQQQQQQQQEQAEQDSSAENSDDESDSDDDDDDDNNNTHPHAQYLEVHALLRVNFTYAYGVVKMPDGTEQFGNKFVLDDVAYYALWYAIRAARGGCYFVPNAAVMKEIDSKISTSQTTWYHAAAEKFIVLCTTKEFKNPSTIRVSSTNHLYDFLAPRFDALFNIQPAFRKEVKELLAQQIMFMWKRITATNTGKKVTARENEKASLNEFLEDEDEEDVRNSSHTATRATNNLMVMMNNSSTTPATTRSSVGIRIRSDSSDPNPAKKATSLNIDEICGMVQNK